LRRLVVAESGQYFLQRDDRTMLVEAARRIRARDKGGGGAGGACGGEQKTSNGGRGDGGGGSGEVKTNGSLSLPAAPAKQKSAEYTMAVASALGWLLRAVKDDGAQHRRRGGKNGYYAAGSLVSSPSLSGRASAAASAVAAVAAASASASYASVLGLPPPTYSMSSALAASAAGIGPPPPLPQGHPDEIRRLHDIQRHTRILNNLANARRLRTQLQQQLLEQQQWR
jgi:hypothetical protein